ncbi:hypothetical protein [Rhizobium leguminosarum]|uniref:hypothetical protein n=1 Tax=Rhizobium leguminosarum TaxID=384 RepID=UPI001FDFBD9A|nr:hypothetical protein [Rhizobium leguminosarum]
MAKTTRRVIYTPEQIDVGVKHKLEKIDSFLSDLFSENSEEKLFLRNILGLLLKVYHMHANNRPMTKMQACRYLPFKNQTVCQKYVEAAHLRGFIDITRDKTDKRRLIVVPKEPLVVYVNEYIANFLDDCRRAIDSAAQVATRPEEGMATTRSSSTNKSPASSGAPVGSSQKRADLKAQAILASSIVGKQK